MPVACRVHGRACKAVGDSPAEAHEEAVYPRNSTGIEEPVPSTEKGSLSELLIVYSEEGRYAFSCRITLSCGRRIG